MFSVSTPVEMPAPVDAVADSAPAELESARLKQITTQLAEEVRPLVERLSVVPDAAGPLLQRARPWADVFLPIVDEVRPRWEDLRPVLEDLRPVLEDLRALLAERLPLLGIATRRFVQRLDLGAMVPSLPVPAIHAPAVTPVIRVPSIRPQIGGLVRRLRPGRWAFRTVSIGLIALVLSNASLRDAMVDEVNWTRSVVQTIEMPALEIPAFELPTITLPAFELPTIELPTIQIPNIELPAFQFPAQQSAAPAKLAQAQFELPPLNAYRATFETQASYPTVPANATVEWVVALRNTGSAGWYRGVAGAQASLALTDGTEAAVQTTAYVAPGQVGWFIVHFRAPAGPGAHSVALFPRIDGRGELPNIGIYTLVTVR
jgi:hypothetical protein